MSGRAPNNDPLAELARLIGQDDPFRDSRPDGGRATARRDTQSQPYVEAPQSAPGWLARSAANAAHHDDPAIAPAPHHDEAAHYDRDRAYEQPARYEDDARYADPQHDAAHHDGADPYRAADHDHDPAHSDAADHYYGDEGHPESYVESDEAPSRRRGGLMTVVAVLGIAVLGTGGVFAYRAYSGSSGPSGPVPVVKAPDAPNKVPPPPQSADNTPVKQIYDRVNDKGGNEKLAPNQEEPIDVKGGNKAPTGGIPGLIAGVPPGGATTQPAPGPQPAPAGEAPKKVKTVPIRPDQPTGTTTAPTRAPNGTGPAPAPAPMRIGSNQTQNPPARNPVVGGFVVQVASQRSESDAQASFRALQTKYPTVLGSQEATIRKADLGDKGVFYRAQLGPFTTQAQANELCSSLKSAGGQCVVQKN